MDRKRKLDVFEQDASKRFQAANGAAHGGIGTNMPGQATLNPYTGRPYSGRYYEILSKRKGQLGVSPVDIKAICTALAAC